MTMTARTVSSTWHDRVGRFIDSLFVPQVANDEAYAASCDQLWMGRRNVLFSSGIPSELALPGKRWMYDGLAKALAVAAGGTLAGRSIGEAGAGSGLGALLAGRDSASITLIDRSPAAIDYSQEIAAKLGLLNRVTFITADILQPESMMLPRRTLDLVFSSGVIEHYSNDEAVAFLRQKAAMVRPGGVVVAFVPQLLSPCMLWRMQVTRAKGNERFMTQGLLRDLFAAAGLADSHPCRCPSPLPATASVRAMAAAAAATTFFPWADMIFGRFARMQ